MPSFKIVKESAPKKTFRVASVIDTFDLPSNKITEKFEGEINIERDWNVGIIVGASGTGKTTIAKEILKEQYYEPENYNSDCVLDDFPSDVNVEAITKMFGAVGFGSVTSWLKPYQVLSNGEKMRVDLARALLSDKQTIVFDEFTSVVNREVAKIGSTCVQKAVRKMNKKFVAVACHYDIVDWLEPDWVFCTDDMTFNVSKKKGQKLKLKYIKRRENIGSFLKSIII